MGKTTVYASLKKNLRANPGILTWSKSQFFKFLGSIFPPLCFHCKKTHENLGASLCKECLFHLDVLPVKQESSFIITFESVGPAQSLMHLFKRNPSQKMASLLAAYMAIQYSQSILPFPDLITAVPSSRFRKWQVGEEAALMLAKELGKILKKPVASLLRRKRQLLRQALLSREERMLLSSEEFQWKTAPTKSHLGEKIILLVDDTITTGATLRCAAKRLWESAPLQIIKMACLDQGYLQQSHKLDQ